MEPWLAGAIPKIPDVKVNVCNTILLIFTPNPCSSPLNTNSMSLKTNLYKKNIKSNKTVKNYPVQLLIVDKILSIFIVPDQN
jgi:hypothetical protein